MNNPEEVPAGGESSESEYQEMESDEIEDDDDSFYYLSDNEYEFDPDEPEDEVSIAQQLHKWRNAKTFETFQNVITAFLTNMRSYHSKLFKTIWDGVNIMDTFPEAENVGKENTFWLLLDLMEESTDPFAYSRFHTPPIKFVQDVCEKYDAILRGNNKLIRAKLLLQRIYLSTNRHLEVQALIEKYPDFVSDIRLLFSERIPRPRTGLFFDDNDSLDTIRNMRYNFVIGLIMTEVQSFEEAQIYLQRAAGALSSIRRDDPIYERRGVEDANRDLLFFQSQLLRSLADLKLRTGHPNEALDIILQQITLDSQNQDESLELPGSYRTLLDIMRSPTDRDKIFELMKGNEFFPGRQLDALAYYALAKAQLTSNLKSAVDMLEITANYFEVAYKRRIMKKLDSSEFLIAPSLHSLYGRLLKSVYHTKMKLVREMPMLQFELIAQTYQRCKKQGFLEENYLELSRDMIEAAKKVLSKPDLDSEMCEKVKSLTEDFFETNRMYADRMPAENIDLRRQESVFYLLMAENFYRLGELKSFIMNAVKGVYNDIQNGGNGELGSIKAKFDNVMERIYMNVKTQDNHDEALLEMLGNEYETLEFLSAASFFNEPSFSRVKPLKTLTQEVIVNRDWAMHIQVMEKILNSKEVSIALSDIVNSLKNEGEVVKDKSLDPREMNEVASCSNRVVRGTTLACIDVYNEDQNSEESGETLNEMFNEKKKLVYFLALMKDISENGSNEENIAKLKSILPELPSDTTKMDPFIIHTANMLASEQLPAGSRNLKRLSARIQSYSEGAGLGFTVFLVGKHVMNGNLEGLGFDALNLYVMPKMGEKISSKIGTLGDRLESTALKTSGPILGRAFGNFAAFLGLYQAIKAKGKATDNISNTMADINIASNSIFIAADIPALGAEVISNFGIEVGLIGEFAGPVGLGVSVAAIVAAQIAEAALEVKRVGDSIQLTHSEKNSLFWRFFFGKDIPEYIKEDLEVQSFYKKYVASLLKLFGTNYENIYLSMPQLVKKYFKVRYGGKNVFFSEVCTDLTMLQDTKITFPEETIFLFNDGSSGTARLSRVLPDNIQGFDISCGPKASVHDGGDAFEVFLNKTIHESSPPKKCKYGHTEVLMEEIWKTVNIGPYLSQCIGGLSISNMKKGQNANLYHLTSKRAAVWDLKRNATVVFSGNDLIVGSANPSDYQNNFNKYLLSKPLESCLIHSKGTNFIFTPDSKFSCNFDDEDSKNIVVLKEGGSFKDSKGINGIVGSNKQDEIISRFAWTIDGNGGNDIIQLQGSSLSTVQTYPGDEVMGRKGIAILPFQLGEISSIVFQKNTFTISSGEWSQIQGFGTENVSEYNPFGRVTLGKDLKIMSKDGLFITPARMKEGGHVTSLQVVQILQNDSKEEFVQAMKILEQKTNANFNLQKQLLSSTKHAVIASNGHQIFHGDQNHQEFFWTGSNGPLDKSMFIIDAPGKYYIKSARGIINLDNIGENQKIGFKKLSKDEVRMQIPDKSIVIDLISVSNDILIQLPGDKYYRLTILRSDKSMSHQITMLSTSEDEQTVFGYDGLALHREYCTHELKISLNMRNEVDFHDLVESKINCFHFPDSKRVIPVKSNENLLLVGPGTILKINNFKFDNFPLSLKLKNSMIEPQLFEKMLKNPYHWSALQFEEGTATKAYLNQPENKNNIYILHLEHLQFDNLEVKMSQDLLLSDGNNRIVLKNWETKPEARQTMFAFNGFDIDSCLLGCEASEIINDINAEKKKRKEVFRNKRSTQETSDTSHGRRFWGTAITWLSNLWSNSSGSGNVPRLSPKLKARHTEDLRNNLTDANPTASLLLAQYGLAMASKTFRESLKKSSQLQSEERTLDVLTAGVQRALEKYEYMNETEDEK